MHVRDATSADGGRIWELNQAAVPAVASVPRAQIDRLAAMACYFRVVDDGTEVVAFLIGLAPDAPYESVHFGWFRERYPSFVYIDRVAVADGSQRRGLGRMLYDDLIAFAAPRAPLVTCEVNTRPRNEVSFAFHAAFGFEIVGSQESADGTKTVALMTRRSESSSA
jgi:predicted GNAT superfamily acetyltransferase